MFKDKGKDVTQEDIYNECFPPIDSNKLIAEFMGSKHPKYEDMYRLPHEDVYVGELQYDSSWDWLMPVVEKINLLDDYRYTVYIASMDTKIVDNITGNVIVEIDCKHSVDELRQSVYEVVVEFIKNQTK